MGNRNKNRNKARKVQQKKAQEPQAPVLTEAVEAKNDATVVETPSGYKGFSREKLIEEIQKNTSSINSNWLVTGKLAAYVFYHCVAHKHDTSLIKTMYLELNKTDWSTLRDAFKRAAFELVGVTISTSKVKDGAGWECKVKMDKAKWEEVKDGCMKEIQALIKDTDEGLRKFKVVRKAGRGGSKNGKVSDGKFAVLAKEVDQMATEWKKIDENSEDLAAFYEELATLKAKYQAKFDILKEGHANLGKATGAVAA